MKDRNDPRDVRPRIGSPLGVYLASVTAAGLAALVASVASVPVAGLLHLLAEPLFWAVAGLALLAEIRPIVAPGKTHPDYGTAALTFCFAAFLYWGFAVGALLRAATILVAALVARRAVFRAMFNVAQLTLSLGAAGLVLSAAGTHPQPLAPWLPQGEELLDVAAAALAYFAVNFVLVDVAVALRSHAPVPATLRAALPSQAVVNLVLLPSAAKESVAREVAVRLRPALAEPIRLGGISFKIEASIGIALYPDDATTVEVLLQRADVAMYLAKERRTGIEMHVPRADRSSSARLSLLGELRHGIDRGELELHYLPKVFLADGWTGGIEALVRWRHPRLGMIMPADFIPAAGQSCLMRDLTACVVDVALAQAARWRQDGLPVQVSVNLCVRDLLDGGLAEMVGRGLHRHGLLPGELMLEINEAVLADGPARGAGALAALAALGVPLSLDDFGTGSSLVGLRRLPVSEIKIDASVIARLFDGPDTRLIVKSLVDLVRALGIRSVAEGVESPDAAGALAAIGFDAAQGRYYCGPLDPAAATTWLAGHLRPTAARPRRGGTHPPRARKPGGRRQPAPVRRTAADG